MHPQCVVRRWCWFTLLLSACSGGTSPDSGASLADTAVVGHGDATALADGREPPGPEDAEPPDAAALDAAALDAAALDAATRADGALDAMVLPDAGVAMNQPDGGPPDAATPTPIGDVHAGGAYHPAEDCSRYPYSAEALLSEREGFGRRARGGDPLRPYLVTSLADVGPGTLREALESPEPYWIGFAVEGEIVLRSGRISARSNKTVDGRGRDITVKGSIRIRDARDVIVSDLKLENDLEGHCTQAGDVLPIGGARGPTGADYHTYDIWINHLEIYNGGDGLIDLRGATDVTVSWVHLHTHKKGLLWSDPDDALSGGGQHVTLHHSFFDRISLRGPQFLGGWLHYYNNYQFEWYEYGAGGMRGAEFLSEHNVYEARAGDWCFVRSQCADPNPCGDFDVRVSKLALINDWDSNGPGYTKSVGDLALNDADIQEHDPGRVRFNPGAIYPYGLEPADQTLVRRLRAGAGPRVRYCR